MNRMRRLSECASPLGWLFLYASSLIPLWVVLHPSLFELFLLFLVDGIALFLSKPFYNRLSTRFHPYANLYLEEVKYEQINLLPFEKKLEFLAELFEFPEKRVWVCCATSSLKLVPGFLLMVFAWKHSVSNSVQLLRAVSIQLFVHIYFAATVYMEAHRYLSSLVTELHMRFGWAQVFQKLQIKNTTPESRLQEGVLLFAIAVFWIIFQSIFILTSEPMEHLYLTIKVGGLGLLAFLLFFRIWYLGRDYFVGGLERLFQRIETLEFGSKSVFLPLHISPILAQFEKKFNDLVERLERAESDLSSWVVQEADKARYRSIGEISSLIAHDLSGPLHAIDFCVVQLKDDRSRIHNDKYLDFLDGNTKRCLELINALRARLKNPSSEAGETVFAEAHAYVVKLLGTQFGDKDFHRVEFVLDPKLGQMTLAISRTSLIHVLDNLYRNSVENMLKHKVHLPKIGIELSHRSDLTVEMLIFDNGTGLPSEICEELQEGAFLSPQMRLKDRSLGLKLTRRLIEMSGGKLMLKSSNKSQGTVFSLLLRVAQPALGGHEPSIATLT